VSNSGAAGWIFANPAMGDTGTIAGTIGSIAAGATSTFTIVVQVGGGTPDGAVISNTATVASVTPDPVPGNDQRTATTRVSLVGVVLAPNPVDPTKTDLIVGGTSGNDCISIFPAAYRRLYVLNNGRLFGPFDPSGRIVVYGRAGNDVLTVSPSVDRRAFLYGQAGNDILTGGEGDDVLVVGDGNDSLLGSGGRNILIGGNGADQILRSNVLNGVLGDNLMIGGWTNYDANDVALIRLLDEWSRTDLAAATSYATRVNHLRGPVGGNNGMFFLNPTTVHDNATLDLLYGGNGQNWYLAHVLGGGVRDFVLGRKSTESVDNI
jgi:Ca2+-binding RTX toxin-like protein